MKHNLRGLLFLMLLCIYQVLHKELMFSHIFLLCILYVQSLSDIQSMEVSNKSMCLLLIVCCFIACQQRLPLLFVLYGAGSVSGILFLLYKITKGSGIGGADVKFMFCCGIFLGFYNSFLSLFYACIGALLFHFITQFQYKKIPFIPFLAFGVYLTLI